MRSRLMTLFAVGTLSLAPIVASCSSDTSDSAKDTVESAKDDLGTAGEKATARATAEALRASLKGNDKVDEEGIRSIAALQQTADDLPGDPDISGITDDDGDGLDDDGKVLVTAGDEQACLTLPETGTDTEVTSGAC